MILADPVLNDLIAALGELARRALIAHVALGITSDESWALCDGFGGGSSARLEGGNDKWEP